MRQSRTRLILVAWALLAASCAPPAQLRYEESLERGPGPAAHAAQSQRLDELMRGLARLRDDRLPRNMDVRGEEERRAERISKVALAMARAADSIPAATPSTELDPAQQQEFVRLANALKLEAQKLADAAPGLSRAEMQTRAEAIDATCDQCHQQFRIPRDTHDAD